MGLFSDKKDKEIASLIKSNKEKDREIRKLKILCNDKDKYFNELMSD